MGRKFLVLILSFILLTSFEVIYHNDKPNICPNISQNDELNASLTVLNDSCILVTVKNISNKTIRLFSHVISEYKQYDYFEVEAITPDYDKFYLNFYDDREKSASIIVELKPNESFSHTIDLLAWSNIVSMCYRLRMLVIIIYRKGLKLE
ncbi:MAG: hypothetical protein WCP69_02635 [Bacteroidota bacterium]